MSKLKILLVEDILADAELLAHALEAAGADVTRAMTDIGAYDLLLSEQPFDALLTDLNLGFGANGFDVAEMARRLRPNIRVLYVTGQRHAVPGNPVADAAFITKAFRTRDTADAIIEHLRLQKARTSPAPPTARH